MMIVTVIIGALGVVFALVFCSGAFNQLCRLSGKRIDGLKDFINTVQSTNDTLFTIGIIDVVIGILPIIAACQKRRKYYITNYIAVGIVVVYQIVFAILVIVFVSNVMQAYNSVDLVSAAASYKTLGLNVQYGEFSTKPWTSTFGYVLVALTLVDAVLLVLNVVWKVLLMKGEAKLLSQSKPDDSESESVENNAVSEVV